MKSWEKLTDWTVMAAPQHAKTLPDMEKTQEVDYTGSVNCQDTFTVDSSKGQILRCNIFGQSMHFTSIV